MENACFIPSPDQREDMLLAAGTFPCVRLLHRCCRPGRDRLFLTYIVRPIKLLCSCYRVEEKRHCTIVDGALAESTFVVMTHDVPMTCLILYPVICFSLIIRAFPGMKHVILLASTSRVVKPSARVASVNDKENGGPRTSCAILCSVTPLYFPFLPKLLEYLLAKFEVAAALPTYIDYDNEHIN